MFEKVLIANRGEIASRIIRTLRRLDVKSVAVFTEADALSRHVAEADEAYCIGEGVAADSYLRSDKILAIAQQAEVQAVHPGYGFLSENAEFAEQCALHEICFIGPTVQQMRVFGLKHTARTLARMSDVPLLAGTDLLEGLEEVLQAAAQIGYPLMLKSTAGGGGIGMRLCRDEKALADAYDTVKLLAQNNFSDDGVFLEQYVEHARHIEVQIFGDGQGKVITLGERDCSMQRRHQKVIEETPATHLTDELRQALSDAAVRLAESVSYQSAGTVEFIVDASSGAFYFLEVNTRLQVEHGVTEMVTGVDLVEWMLLQASGELPALESFDIQIDGAAIQARIYAENPTQDFQPSSGTLTAVQFPQTTRIETWIDSGVAVTPFYDPMLAKVIVHAATREQAIDSLTNTLEQTVLQGVETNRDYLRQVVSSTDFRNGHYNTRFLNDFQYHTQTVDILIPGTHTTIQDYPGRLGYWHVGVPPSGPMDALAFRLANRLVGNSDGVAGLEITLTGPKIRFNCNSVIAITGAPIPVHLDDKKLSFWRAYAVKAGAVLQFGKTSQHGCRAYLAVQGGFQITDYLGSQSTFTLGQFGGHSGRMLRSGDVLHLQETEDFEPRLMAADRIPVYTDHWVIGVLYGPHGAPDFFTEADMVNFFTAEWVVHHHSNRTGIRLLGPKPEWARSDGGEAGLHPSNIHDNAYAIGAVDFTGDMPVILGSDGPSLGGFVCPVTVVHAELWKLGQLKPGDKVRFNPLSSSQAETLMYDMDAAIECNEFPQHNLTLPKTVSLEDPVLYTIAETVHSPRVVYRQSGDCYVLIEYGPVVLDLHLRIRIHALMLRLQEAREGLLDGIIDLTPGIRSLQVHFNARRLPRYRLLELLIGMEAELTAIDDIQIPSRIVHLPLSWDDGATRLAIEKYTQSVRNDAPWCPSNIEFIRRINGLDDIEAVQRIVFEASYLVLGLGDVYLGAPVATPIDPRHRLVTTKYNPARTWTPENAVGIGGAYLCIYGMEGPGGYQFVGRTVQMWNRYRQTADFKEGKPWLLRFFDQIRFYPVSESELLQLRNNFITGRFQLRIEETTFDLKAYQHFLYQNNESIQLFKHNQQVAFEAERQRWEKSGQQAYVDDSSAGSVDTADMQSEDAHLPAGSFAINASITGTVWKVLVCEGQHVTAGTQLVIIESMKMEFAVETDRDGTVQQILCREGAYVIADQRLVILSSA